MSLLKALRPHISADGEYRAVGETYDDANAEHVALRVEAGIVELAKGKSKKKDEAPAGDDQPPADETGDNQPPAGEETGLIED